MNKLAKYIVLTVLILLIAGSVVIVSLEYTVGCESKSKKLCDDSDRAKVINKITGVGCDGACISLNYTLEIVSNKEICTYVTKYEEYDIDKYKIGSTYDVQLLSDGFCTFDTQLRSLEILFFIVTIIFIILVILLILFIFCCMIDYRPKNNENDSSDSSNMYPL